MIYCTYSNGYYSAMCTMCYLITLVTYPSSTLTLSYCTYSLYLCYFMCYLPTLVTYRWTTVTTRMATLLCSMYSVLSNHSTYLPSSMLLYLFDIPMLLYVTPTHLVANYSTTELLYLSFTLRASYSRYCTCHSLRMPCFYYCFQIKLVYMSPRQTTPLLLCSLLNVQTS
jgi:hypothetical protein